MAVLRATPSRSRVLVWAWAGVLATSALIPIVWRAVLSGPDSAWLYVVQLGLVLALLAGARSIPSHSAMLHRTPESRGRGRHDPVQRRSQGARHRRDA